MSPDRRRPPDVRPEPLVASLSRLSALNAVEMAVIRAMAGRAEEQRAGAELLGEGESAPKLIVSGWGCRQRLLADGRRQVFGFLLPGDPIGVCVDSRPVALATAVALTRVVTVDAAPLVAAARDAETHPGLARIVALAPEAEERRLLDHIVRLGRRSGAERVAHLLLEVRDRLVVAGVGGERRFPFPVTQETLADALGLSIVHINRILQQFRRDGLIQVMAGHVSLISPVALAAVAEAQGRAAAGWRAPA